MWRFRNKDELPCPVAVVPTFAEQLGPRSQLMLNVFGLVDYYDETHSLTMESRRRTNLGAFVKELKLTNPFVHSNEMSAL